MLTKMRLFRSLPNPARVFRGGRIDDTGRLPRYALIFTLAAGGLWTPIVTYLKYTPASYTSDVSLILPGSGAQASVNLAELGQASSSAASAFSSSRVSPTQTYKRLLAANRTLERAAAALDLPRSALGEPRIKLVDETSLIHFSMAGPSPEAAQERAETILEVFLEELYTLRQDELAHRERAARLAIGEYEQAVAALRSRIAAVQAESGLVSYEHYQDIVTDRDDLAGRVEDARSERDAARAAIAGLSRQLGTDPDTAALNLRLLADPEFQELAQTLALQHAELAEAQGRFGSRHPVVTSIGHAVTGTQARLVHRGAMIGGARVTRVAAQLDLAPNPDRSALLSELVALSTEQDRRDAELTALEAQLAARNARVDRLAPLASTLDDLSRDHKVAEAVFGSALARTDSSKAEVYASYPLVQVLADASLPDRSTSPRSKIALAAGIAATLMLLISLTLAWLRQPLVNKLLKTSAA